MTDSNLNTGTDAEAQATEDDNRIPRESFSREATVRNEPWKPASQLPEPDKLDGYVYRWVRVSAGNQADGGNVNAKFREGWEPVPMSEQPNLAHIRDNPNSHFTDGIECSGLLLCKMPVEIARKRTAYYANMNAQQMKSVDSNLMSTNDPRMPLFNESTSNVKFGDGKK